MNIAIQTAAEGKQELSFWPAITSGYIYSQSGGLVWLVACILLCLFGAPMFILIRNTRQVVEQSKDLNRLRKRVDRDNRRNNERNQWLILLDVVFEQFPDRSRMRVYVLSSCLLTVVAAAVIFICLVARVIRGDVNDLVGIGLFALPIMYIGILITRISWRDNSV